MARTSLEETARTEGGEAAAETITEQSTAGNSQPLSAAQKKRQKKKRAAARKAAAAGEDDQHDGHIGDEDGIKQNESQSSKRGKGAAAQTDPAEVQVRILFNGMEFPAGERRSYSNDNAWRETDEEKRHQENMDARDGGALHDARCAAEVHREARMLFKKHAQPGVKLIDLCEQLESNVRTMIEADGLKAGVAFPTGVSLNNIAAHWTPNPGDTTVLNESDVMKVDFGTQVNGRIIDSAFTLSHDPQFDKLLEASKEATEAGIRAAGIDARLNELGDAIQEVMESYEVEINGKPHQVRCVQNLNGHNIAPYTIHAGKSIPLTRGGPATKMEEGEFFAVETFGSTGKGWVNEDLECSHYMMNQNTQHLPQPRLKTAKNLLKSINSNFSTLAFCKRYLERIGETRYNALLNQLCDSNFVEPYPPLCDVKGSYVSQFEHTIYLGPTCKEILSRGDDY